MPDRDKELGFGGNAAGTLTPSSRRSSLVSGQLMYYPTNSAVLEEPVEEKVSRSGVLGPTSSCVLGPTVIHWNPCSGSHWFLCPWVPQLRTCSGVLDPTGSCVLGPTYTLVRCPGSHSYSLEPVFWVPHIHWFRCSGSHRHTDSGVLGPTYTLDPGSWVPHTHWFLCPVYHGSALAPRLFWF